MSEHEIASQAPAHCCPVHEPLTEKQVKGRLNFALISGVLLLAGVISKNFFGQIISGASLEILACVLLGGPILKDSWSGLKRGHIGFPSLVALAFLACLSQGEYLTAGLVAFFMIMADQLENRTAIGAGKSIEALIRSTPEVIHFRNQNGDTIEKSLSSLKIGDEIFVLPGEMVPVDGTIIEGESSVDESSMTGESLPVDKSISTPVYAGTTNLTGRLHVKVEKLGDDTTLGKVKKLILSAADSKSPLMSVMEKNAGWYTPLVLMFALLTYYFQKGHPDAMNLAISILIMACPCSLVLATPSVMIASITAAARAGILVKNVVELEHFHKVDHIFFDKTGTLTTGQMEVAKMTPLAEMEASEILRLAGSMAQHSNHPASRGVHEAMKKARLKALEFSSVEEFHGKGLSGIHENDTFYLGRIEWVVEQINQPAQKSSARSGSHLLFASKQKGLLGEFILEDHLREDSVTSLKGLRKLGIGKLSLLTGDAWEPARKVASAVGFDQVFAKCLPGDKLKILTESKEKGDRTAVIGDGINDAPVLAAGNVGIAMGALGSQVAIESASITLMTNHLDRLPFLYRLSKSAKQLIWINIIIGLSVILIGLLFIFFFLSNPVAAAILHNLSAFIILFNSARVVKLKP